MPTVGQVIIESIAAQGIDRVFCVPGESYLGLLDPLFEHPTIDTVVARHEAGAGFMALADARLSGRPGIAMVSRGPGASNAAIAVHTAQQDAVPFILLIGQVAARDVRRDSFQEIDYGHMFGRIAKWTAEITDPSRARETMLRAFAAATTGTPGPVVIAVPEDILTTDGPHAPAPVQRPPRAAATEADLVSLQQWLGSAERPLLLAGSAFDRPGGREALARFTAQWNIPTVVSFRRQDLFDNASSLYAGDMGLSNPADQMAALGDTDLLMVAGARLSDITTQGYTWPDLVRPQMRMVHIHADAGVIGTHFAADLAIAADPIGVIDTLSSSRPPPIPAARAAWIDRLASIRQRIAGRRSAPVRDGIAFETVAAEIGRHLPRDAIVTLDAGTFGAPMYRVVAWQPTQRLLAPISGAMGFGVPAAVAASLRDPTRTVVCCVGDGGFLMTGSELAVALERRLPLKIFLSENRSYASIRIHQERDYPGRVIGTSFVNPDLAAIGRAYGCTVHTIASLADLALVAEALRAPGPQFVLVETSLDAVLPAPTARPST